MIPMQRAQRSRAREHDRLWLTTGPFHFGLCFVFGQQPFPHGNAAENRVKDEATHGAAFQFGCATNSIGFFFGTTDEKSSFLITRHSYLPPEGIRISQSIQWQSGTSLRAFLSGFGRFIMPHLARPPSWNHAARLPRPELLRDLWWFAGVLSRSSIG